jgi:hypothetical protein
MNYNDSVENELVVDNNDVMKYDNNDKKLNEEKIDNNFNNNNKCKHDNNDLSNTPLVNDNFLIQDDLVQELCTESNHAENNLVKRNNLVTSDNEVAPAERNVAKKFKQVYSKDLTKQIDVTAPLMQESD